MDSDIRIAFEKSIDKFVSRVVPTKWEPRSILVSEGFSVCGICDYMGIDLLIESGVYNGRSTTIWAKYLYTQAIIIAVDITIRKQAEHNLYKFIKEGFLSYYQGNSNQLLPNFIDKNKEKSIGLVIDGPKNLGAVDLAKVCFKYPQVKFAAFHDTHKGTGVRKCLEAWSVPQFYTDDEEFVNKYKFLDKDESQIDIEQNLQWTPYKILPDRDLGGSYGMTMCIAFNK